MLEECSCIEKSCDFYRKYHLTVKLVRRMEKLSTLAGNHFHEKQIMAVFQVSVLSQLMLPKAYLCPFPSQPNIFLESHAGPCLSQC